MKKTLLVASLLVAMNAQAADEPKDFTLDGEFGLIVTTGNTESKTVKGKISGHQELEAWSNDFNAEGLYQEDEDGATAQEYFLSGQGNYKLENPDHRIFVFGSYKDNRFSSYDYQSTIAVGWSEKLWSDDVSKFEYSVGPGYSFNKTVEGESENSAILRGALAYERKMSETSTFKQALSTEIGSDNTKSRSETSISAQLMGALSMKFSVILDHNSQVVGDNEKLDTQTAVTLVYTFF
jgi:putative salt-induced outer membrane protein YdiY